MSNQFNANFLIAIATINPVFFLALTLQGPFYSSLVERVKNAAKAVVKSDQENPVSWKSAGIAYAALPVVIIAAAIFMAGLLGEFLALIELYRQYSPIAGQRIMLWTTVGMLLLVACIPGAAMLSAFLDLMSATAAGIGKDIAIARGKIQVAPAEDRPINSGGKTTADEDETPPE
jgi:C4-dicarboxylate transporter